MTWVKIDDGFFRHPKIRAAGRDARDFYLAALCYCNENLTDGLFPEYELRRLAAEADVDDPRACVAALIEHGLVAQEGKGFVIHDYLSYQPSRASVLSQRQHKSEAGQRSAAKRGVEQPVEQPVERGVEPVSRIPYPESDSRIPYPHTPPNPLSPSGSVGELVCAPDDGFEAFWTAYPAKENRTAAVAAWQKLRAPPDLQSRILCGIERAKASARWQRGVIPHAHNWLAGRRWEDEFAPPATQGKRANALPAAPGESALGAAAEREKKRLEAIFAKSMPAPQAKGTLT